MEKRKKDSDAKKFKAGKPCQFQAQPRPPPRAQPVLSEKDKAILDDVENIIWNPDRLKKLENDGKARKQAK